MRNFWVALGVLALIEVVALLLIIQKLTDVVAGGRTLSIRDVIVAFAVVALPPLLAVGLSMRFRSDRVRRAAVARVKQISPDSVVFAIGAWPEVIAGINRIKAVSGSAPLAVTRHPLIATVSKTFLSISTTTSAGTMVPGVTIPVSMISAVTAIETSQSMPGTRGKARMQALHFRIADGRLDLVGPLQTDGLNATTTAEASSIARDVSDRIGLTRPAATLLTSDGSWRQLR